MLVSFGHIASVAGDCQTVTPDGPTVDHRTVARSEIGLIFMYPNRFSWRDVGAYVGVPGSEYFGRMSPDALKIQHGRFQHFCQADDDHYAFFPFSRLKDFQAREVAENRQPFLVTATYRGKKRPVYFAWSLSLRDNVPQSSSDQWMQAVDVSSDRYLDFWINQYFRRVLWKNQPAHPDQWIGLDNCAFRYDLYGVIGDDGRFVPDVPWDPPFAQTSAQFLTSIKQFFQKLSIKAPDIKTMCNIGSLKDWRQFKELYANIPGVMTEDLAEKNPREFARTGQCDILTALSWFGSQGRVAVLRAIIARSSLEEMRTAYVVYLLVKGPNFFFAPAFVDTANAVPRDQYAGMRSALGEPIDDMAITPDRLKGQPYNMYSRTYQRGIIYANWTGRTQRIVLPTAKRYRDSEGKLVTILSLPDLTGDYVTVDERPNVQ